MDSFNDNMSNLNKSNIDDTSTTKSPIENRNLKHFKKSMIVEYENCINEDSHSSSSSSSSSSTVSTKSNYTDSKYTRQDDNLKQTNKNESSSKYKHHKDTKSKKHKLDDVFENENSDDDYNDEDTQSKTNSSSSESKSDQDDENSDESFQNVKKKKKLDSTTSSSSHLFQKKSSSSSSKLDKKDKKKTYCICKSTDTQRFMIACDNCDEWYHGDCVGVTQSLSKKIKAFYCHLCRFKKKSLCIKYKSKFHECLTNLKTNQTTQNKITDDNLLKFLKETKIRERKEIELNQQLKNCQKQHSVKTDADNSTKPKTSKPKQDDTKNIKTSTDNSTTSNTANISSINTTTTTTTTNTTSSTPFSSSSMFNIDNLMPNKVYGKSNISNEEFENFFSAITKLGHDAAQLAAAKEAEQHQLTNQETSNQLNIKQEINHDLNENSKSRATNSETDENSNTNYNDEDTNDDNEYSDFEDDNKKTSNKESKTKSKSRTKNLKSSTRKQLNSKRGSQNKNIKQSKRRHRTSSNSRAINNDDDEDTLSSFKTQIKENMQCLGPECVNKALNDSKYCSNECGLKLAKNRLLCFLKSRVDLYNQTPCLSNQRNQSELDRINSEIESLKQKLNDLEKKHAQLDELIERAKFKKINPNIEKERDRNLESNEIEICCVTCGNVCTEKIALKHMEKCFNKVESQAFFGSYFKTRIDGQSMFCDYYNPQTKMYCKRLKVICPEHFTQTNEKDKKINDDEVCGCPLPKQGNVLEDSDVEICLASKRSCYLHFKWEKMRRAHIDLEKLRTWLKLEELMEQKRTNENSLNQRAGLLSILLHQTTANTDSSITLTSTTNESINEAVSTLTEIKSNNFT